MIRKTFSKSESFHYLRLLISLCINIAKLIILQIKQCQGIDVLKLQKVSRRKELNSEGNVNDMGHVIFFSYEHCTLPRIIAKTKECLQVSVSCDHCTLPRIIAKTKECLQVSVSCDHCTLPRIIAKTKECLQVSVSCVLIKLLYNHIPSHQRILLQEQAH